jgi:replicative DNA helicase
MGKAQPLDAKIKTIDGWKLMGDLRFGDRLASVDGQFSMVTGIYPRVLSRSTRLLFLMVAKPSVVMSIYGA